MTTTNPPKDEILLDALLGFTGCIGDALLDVCSVGLTYGDSYVPFDPDPDDELCETDEQLCSQAWVRVTDVAPAPGTLETWVGDCAIELVVGLEVGVLRCVEIPEDGEAPTATDALSAAMTALRDMNDIHCAAMNCEVWASINSGGWSPMGPLGGQHGGVWTFSVTI